MTRATRATVGLLPMVAMLALVTLAFVLVVLRSEATATELRVVAKENATALYAQCQTSQRNATALNDTLEVLANSVTGRTDLTFTEIRAQSQAYRAAKPVVPDCGTRP